MEFGAKDTTKTNSHRHSATVKGIMFVFFFAEVRCQRGQVFRFFLLQVEEAKYYILVLA